MYNSLTIVQPHVEISAEKLSITDIPSVVRLPRWHIGETIACNISA